ncbi:putative metal-dependent hydrolase, TIM-barrel fold [Streptoalloteichus tenebrarius]|uniref:Metal-dependent hydrolase, TIM-barrel fold n=1 Tax=Streptoalloteichus tenebrarius (strain ATCC 17920 / DSM 40477 / JCM 4838 / CBS 697.72 / NBRC 16177 / NCIMB 11028 / NRRL B-12390 / A12253. 1 / ISP 5477) TaxID=1933 RepID=A0ABT1HXS6_STRSD|nr:amidohydrolase family protein [Streptoalloteichus tenebrarius]MCP2260314.1 putative metal-dependent hydrolase, TIM-barrel fold [Streptoalloteichus tenebrarius]BFF03064.1 hypothetical protein GCM10020241_47390 [Streptoalloteichus tenebrarius]
MTGMSGNGAGVNGWDAREARDVAVSSGARVRGLEGIDLFDVDVLVGRHPDRPGQDGDPAAVWSMLNGNGIHAGAVCSVRGAVFDLTTGNTETHAVAMAYPRLVPVSTVDLRDALRAEREIERMAEDGARVLRLFPDEQRVEADFPGFRHVARRAAERGLVVLTGGDVRRVWRPFADLGATVVFLDTHCYHLADFLLLARDEPGFHTSTRLLNSVDSLELVAAEVGARRLLFGSRAPLSEPTVPLLRLSRSGLEPEQRALVGGGNARRLLGLDGPDPR